MRTTQTRKRQYPARRRQNKEEKNQYDQGWKWEDKEKPMTKKECTLEAEVLLDLDHDSTPFDIFQTVARINETPRNHSFGNE